jgi:hypothetical protein
VAGGPLGQLAGVGGQGVQFAPQRGAQQQALVGVAQLVALLLGAARLAGMKRARGRLAHPNVCLG